MWRAINKIEYDKAVEEGKTEQEALESSVYHGSEIEKLFGLDIRKKEICDWRAAKVIGSNIQTDFTEVHPKKMHLRRLPSKTITVAAHFSLPKTYSGEIDYNYHTSEIHHHLRDIFIGYLNKIRFNILGLKISFNCLSLKPYRRICELIEKRREMPPSCFKDHRIADILLELKEPNIFFGKGIVIEFKRTETDESIAQKREDWGKAGYTYTYFSEDDFDLEVERPTKFLFDIDNSKLNNIMDWNDLVFSETTEKIDKIVGGHFSKALTNLQEDLIRSRTQAERLRNDIQEITNMKEEFMSDIKNAKGVINNIDASLRAKTDQRYLELENKINAKLDSIEWKSYVNGLCQKYTQEAIQIIYSDHIK